MTIAGGVAKVLGKNMAKSGGANEDRRYGLMWGGKLPKNLAWRYKAGGKTQYRRYNAFAPRTGQVVIGRRLTKGLYPAAREKGSPLGFQRNLIDH